MGSYNTNPWVGYRMGLTPTLTSPLTSNRGRKFPLKKDINEKTFSGSDLMPF